jgi:hypothetical protein
VDLSRCQSSVAGGLSDRRPRWTGRPHVGRTVREGSMDSPPSSGRPEARLGLSIFQGALLEVLLRFRTVRSRVTYRPPGVRGPSAPAVWIVCLGFHRVTKSFASCVSLSL